jgi:hypothetical protein
MKVIPLTCSEPSLLESNRALFIFIFVFIACPLLLKAYHRDLAEAYYWLQVKMVSVYASGPRQLTPGQQEQDPSEEQALPQELMSAIANLEKKAKESDGALQEAYRSIKSLKDKLKQVIDAKNKLSSGDIYSDPQAIANLSAALHGINRKDAAKSSYAPKHIINSDYPGGVSLDWREPPRANYDSIVLSKLVNSGSRQYGTESGLKTTNLEEIFYLQRIGAKSSRDPQHPQINAGRGSAANKPAIDVTRISFIPLRQ